MRNAYIYIYLPNLTKVAFDVVLNWLMSNQSEVSVQNWNITPHDSGFGGVWHLAAGARCGERGRVQYLCLERKETKVFRTMRNYRLSMI